MNAVCPSCQKPFEADDDLAGGPGVPLCDDCSTAVRAPRSKSRPSMPAVEMGNPVGVPQTPPEEHAAADEPKPSAPGDGRKRRPRAPELSFAPRQAEHEDEHEQEHRKEGEEARVAILPGVPEVAPVSARGDRMSLGEIEPASSGGPGLLDGGFDSPSRHGELTEPVSLKDIGAVLAPVAAPPPWSGGKGGASAKLSPEGVPVKAKKPLPRFFQVDSVPPPSVDVAVDQDSPPRNSGHEDLRVLTSKLSGKGPKRPDADLIRLQGALFAAAPPRPPPLPPDLALFLPGVTMGNPEGVPQTPPVAPVAMGNPEGVPQTPPVEPTPVAPVPPAPPAPRPPSASGDGTLGVEVPVPVRASPPVTVLAERRPAAAAVAAARRSGIASVAVALASLSAVAVVVALRFVAASPSEPTTGERAKATVAPTEIVAPPVVSTARAPETRVKEVLPRTGNPAGVSPQIPPARTVAEAPRPVVTVVEPTRPPAPPTATARAPVEAGEFDVAAARAALATAAGAAAACKQADDPTGGGRVSVTFAPSGRVMSARVVGPPFQGTRIGGCIAATFRTATVPPFSGDPVAVTKEVIVR